MKLFVAIAALFILARPVFPVVEYIANYNYIVKELCVNKEKPQLQCNGKCHLMKELANAAEGEKPLSGKKAAHQETETLFFQSINSFEFTRQTIPVFIKKNFPRCNTLYNPLWGASVFHPPAFIS